MLVQQSRLGEIDRDELAEVITDAWAAQGPEDAWWQASSWPRERLDRARQVDPARLAALDVLKAVRVDDAYTNLVLPGCCATTG